MRCAKLVTALVLIVFSGCDCDSELQRVCPAPVECWVEQDVENTEANLIKDNFPWYATVGTCSLGTTACDDRDNVYCDGVTYPTEEICDFKDNDCDEETDEGFDEDNDGVTTCGGDCDDTNSQIHPHNTERCDGFDNDCDGVIPPEEYVDADGDGYVHCRECDDNNANTYPGALEICDTEDNDCDGQIDENVSEAWSGCGPPSTLGLCERDIPVCIDGEMYCPNAVHETPEGCDGEDNDCDGQTDENLAQECSTACGIGFEYCDSGNWIGCNAPQPELEICDGLDNDCDGQIDNVAAGFCSCIPDSVSLCSSNVLDSEGNPLNCGTGIKTCDEMGQWGDCVWATNSPEQCNNYDDDCDGVIDGMVQACGESQFSGIGLCKMGEQECVEGVWTDCEGDTAPTEEVCDEEDNDCDGEIDESLNNYEKVDMVFAIDGSGSMCGYVTALAQGIGQYVTDFEDTEHRFSLVIFPFELNSNPSIPDVPWIMITNLVDVNTFVAVLNSIVCNYPGSEPGYDTTYDITDPSNTVGINWRADAHPYVIIMTDEADSLSWAGNTESDVAVNTNNCQIGNCANEPWEIYVFTKVFLFPLWDEITFFDTDRLISIDPPDENEYANKLRNVFTNVCL